MVYSLNLFIDQSNTERECNAVLGILATSVSTVDGNGQHSGCLDCSARILAFVGLVNIVGAIAAVDTSGCPGAVVWSASCNLPHFLMSHFASLAPSVGTVVSTGNMSFKSVTSCPSVGSRKNASACLVLETYSVH